MDDDVSEAPSSEGDTGDAADPTAAGDDESPDYRFEGYSVEFLDRVAMMPVSPSRDEGRDEGSR